MPLATHGVSAQERVEALKRNLLRKAVRSDGGYIAVVAKVGTRKTSD